MRRLMRFFITFLTLLGAFALAAVIALLPDRLAFDGARQYTFFVGHDSSDCKVISAEGERAAAVRLTLSGVCGESATYGELDVDDFLSQVNGKIVFVEELSDSVNYYCEADLPYSVELYGREINLHVCVKTSGVTVASPIIFGGY